jgi:uncharacterized alkaline shock family protein YloU
MSIDKVNQHGTIHISLDAISDIASAAALSCYGVVGLAPKSTIIEEMSRILKQPEFSKAIVVRKKKDQYIVDLYLIVAYGVKVTEIVGEVQKKVKYDLELKFSMKFAAVNVYVQSLKTV